MRSNGTDGRAHLFPRQSRPRPRRDWSRRLAEVFQVAQAHGEMQEITGGQ